MSIEHIKAELAKRLDVMAEPEPCFLITNELLHRGFSLGGVRYVPEGCDWKESAARQWGPVAGPHLLVPEAVCERCFPLDGEG